MFGRINLLGRSHLVRPLFRRAQVRHSNNFSKVTFTVKEPLLPYGPFGSLVKPVLFTVGVAGGSVLLAEWYANNKNHRPWAEIRQEFRNTIRNIPWIGELSPTQKVAYTLIGLNSTIFILWQIGRLKPKMVEYFTHSVLNRRASPMLLSCFSHSDLLHIAVNLYVLYSFLTPVQSVFGLERFLALYVGAGVFSSLVSHMNLLARRSPVGSLGASGAISGVLAAFCYIFPDVPLSFFGIPALSLPAQQALQVIVGIEFTILLFLSRRLPIDCAAHLGGFAFGTAYAYWQFHAGHIRRYVRRQH